jgi:hypothetical protein
VSYSHAMVSDMQLYWDKLCFNGPRPVEF